MSEPNHRTSPESQEARAVRELAAGTVRRLLEIGLPENMALHARDAVLVSLENYRQRWQCGEWGPQ